MTTMASGRRVRAPIRVENAAGSSPKTAVNAVIIIGRRRCPEPRRIASSNGTPSSRKR